MKLDRNSNPRGRGKYALLLNRKVVALPPEQMAKALEAISTLTIMGLLDQGNTEDSEFFVIRLKDQFATPALCAYAREAFDAGEMEFGGEVMLLADRAESHPSKKKPD